MRAESRKTFQDLMTSELINHLHVLLIDYIYYILLLLYYNFIINKRGKQQQLGSLENRLLSLLFAL